MSTATTCVSYYQGNAQGFMFNMKRSRDYLGTLGFLWTLGFLLLLLWAVRITVILTMTYVVFTTTQGEEMNEGPTLTSSCHCQAACVWARVLSFWYHFILPDTWKWSVVFMTTQRRRKARINFQLSNFGQVIAPEQWCLPLVCLTLGNGVLFYNNTEEMKGPH